ncbi:MAG: HAD hydrolase-like protein [Hydrotalea sp.]|nr:HAD hydrolase-like protein [Hydrotalea sp.]
MTNISRPKLIIFDWDNTLVDSWDIIHDSMMATFDRLRIKRQWESKAETQLNGQHSLRDSFPKIFGCQFMKARDVYYEEYISRHLRELKPLTGAAETLAALHDQQITMAVVSNKNHPVLLAEVAHVGWGKFFSAVVGAGHAVRDKPDPAPFAAVMEKIYGAEKNWPARNQIWYVGDMNVDVTFARAIGVVSIMIPIEPLKQPADRELKQVAELVGLVG